MGWGVSVWWERSQQLLWEQKGEQEGAQAADRDPEGVGLLVMAAVTRDRGDDSAASLWHLLIYCHHILR